MRALGVLAVVALLAGCMSAEWHKSRMAEKAQGCLAIGGNVAEAAQCLSARGINLQRSEHMPELYFYYSCWPYWGYPIVSSCGSVLIHTEPDGVIKSWKIDGTIEELHA